jgi:hypothetical protein
VLEGEDTVSVDEERARRIASELTPTQKEQLFAGLQEGKTIGASARAAGIDRRAARVVVEEASSLVRNRSIAKEART